MLCMSPLAPVSSEDVCFTLVLAPSTHARSTSQHSTALPTMLQHLRFKMLFCKALAAFLPKSLVCRTADSQQHVSILLALQPRQSKPLTLLSLALCKLSGNVRQHRECHRQSGAPQTLPQTIIGRKWGLFLQSGN